MVKRRGWSKEELILAVNLYCKTPFGKIHQTNPAIIKLSQQIDRTPGAISYKLANFAHLDPSLPRKGASNVSALDRSVWDEFYANWDKLAYESELAVARLSKNKLPDGEELDIPAGVSRERVVKTRVNQHFFRQTVLASYNFTCCVTGITNPQLLIAGHIVPWSRDEHNRTNPRNGLCLNALHDKAFDVGLISLSDELELLVSQELAKTLHNDRFFTPYDGKSITLPSRFTPDPSFISYHRKNIYRG